MSSHFESGSDVWSNVDEEESPSLSPWTLVFDNSELEDDFLKFLVPGGPPVSNPLICVAFLVLVLYFEFTQWHQIGGGSLQGLFLVCVACLALATLVSSATFIFYRRSSNKARRIALHRLCDAAICLFVLTSVFAEFITSEHAISKECRDDGALYREEGKKYFEANCYRTYHAFFPAVLSLLVTKRIRFREAVITAIIGQAFVTVFLSNVHSHTANVAAGHIITVAIYLAFVCYVRYLLESGERRYFLTRRRMERLIWAVQSRTGDLEECIRALLPPLLVTRSSYRHAAEVDASAEAIVLVMSVPNFHGIANRHLPLTLVELLAKQQNRVTKEVLVGLRLQQTSLVLDEITAVGNLIRKDDVMTSAFEACSAALKAVVLEALPLPLRAAVHLGDATGKFDGKSWIRYNVTGEAVDTARAAVVYSEAGEVTVTDEIVHVLRGHLEVNEIGRMELPPSDVPVTDVSSSEQSQAVGRTLWRLGSTSAALSNSTEAFPLSVTSGSKQTFSTPAGSKTEAQSATSQSDVNVVDQVLGLHREAIAQLETESDGFAMSKAWCCFDVFTNKATEAEFIDQRRKTMQQRALRMWLAYGCLLIGCLVTLMLDLVEPQGTYAAVMISVCVLLAIVVAVLPTVAERYGVSPQRWRLPWFVLAMVVPLFTIISFSYSRPSALGNDVRHMMVVGALVRTPAFLQARHQLVVTPALVLLAHSQYALPGGVILFSIVFFYVMVVFMMIADRDNDTAQRMNFVAERRIATALAQLEREEKVREGLVRSTLPGPLVGLYNRVRPGMIRVLLVPDCYVLLTTLLPEPAATAGIPPKSNSLVEQAVDESFWLDIAKAFGDSYLVLGHIPLSDDGCIRNKDEHRSCTDDVIAFCKTLGEHGRHRVLVECDTTAQVIDAGGLLRFTAMGVGVTRTLAISAATDRLLGGVLVTDRALRALKVTSPRRFDDAFSEQLLPPWSVRGAGIVRLTRLSTHAGHH